MVKGRGECVEFVSQLSVEDEPGVAKGPMGVLVVKDSTPKSELAAFLTEEVRIDMVVEPKSVVVSTDAEVEMLIIGARVEMVERVVGPKSVVVSTNTEVEVCWRWRPARAPTAATPTSRKLVANILGMLAAQEKLLGWWFVSCKCSFNGRGSQSEGVSGDDKQIRSPPGEL